jgi:hypothetical protein
MRKNMGYKAWTAHGERMSNVDRGVIRAIADKDEMAARIFVTGESSEKYLGNSAVDLLVSINDVFYEKGAGFEPLFVQTRNNTVRMLRFDPEFVWGSFHPDIFVRLAGDEVRRLGMGMDPFALDYFDFYESVVDSMRKLAQGYAIAAVKAAGTLEDFYHGIYLSCLLLYGKPGYMGEAVAEHFATEDAAAFVRDVELLRLDGNAVKKVESLRKEFGGIKAVTNPEVNFLVDLYESDRKTL